MKINSIWEDLENDNSFLTGILFKRYSASVLPDVYVALRAPEKLRCIAVHIGKANEPDIRYWNKYKDIKVEIINDERSPSKSYLLLIIVNQHHKDIFSILCEDLINDVASVVEETVLMKNLFNRLAKWQTLFERVGLQGLTQEAQRGLYGELYFLRKFIAKPGYNIYFINSWQVPSNTVQDFHFGNWAVEVKTTHGNNHQKIQISSERQLDDSVIPNIFLCHLSLDIRNSHGETLNDLIEMIENTLVNDMIALNTFKLKLFEIGYFDIHKPFYQDVGYNIRQECIYSVIGEFPRIKEEEIRKGVGDVKYSIVIADCLSYVRSETELFETIVPS